MNEHYLNICEKEIEELLEKGLIRKSYSLWSYASFYVENAIQKEKEVPRLVINYKPLNKVLRWICYSLPNKKDLFNKLHSAKIFSKFDMKSEYWKIQIDEKVRYKTTFTVIFCH